jgi:hypothetical protein
MEIYSIFSTCVLCAFSLLCGHIITIINTVTGHGLGDQGLIPARGKGFLFVITSIQALRFTQSPIPWEAGIGQWHSAGLRLDDRGFESRQGLGIFLVTASRPALGPTQSPIQWVLGALSLKVKRPECEADHSSSSSAEVENEWNYASASSKDLHRVVLS